MIPKVSVKAPRPCRPDFVLHRDAKVLCVLPLPRLVDTARGPRVLYTRPDGWYSNQPWDEPMMLPPLDEDEE